MAGSECCGIVVGVGGDMVVVAGGGCGLVGCPKVGAGVTRVLFFA